MRRMHLSNAPHAKKFTRRIKPHAPDFIPHAPHLTESRYFLHAAHAE
jgi:hypothetical protein